MPSLFKLHPRGKSLHSSALLIVLLGLVLVTVLTVTLFLVSRYERISARIALGKATSESLADLAADLALLRINEATGDGLSEGKMWVSEPGRIRVYERSDLTGVTDYNLFSALPGPDTATPDENNVDLNRRLMDGSYPIAPPAAGKTGATMKVGWIALPAHPGGEPSATNPITGRIAFWVDDESCKVNINTADGSRKNTRESFGFGTPSEISLQALETADGTALTAAQAGDIADFAWSAGFNSEAEIGRVKSVPAGFYEANKFNITHYSKTPELTFYGEPRIHLLPTVGASSITYTTLTGAYYPQGSASVGQLGVNVAEQVDFVYPTSSQLPHAPGGFYDYPTSHKYLADNLVPQYPLGRNGQSINTPKQAPGARSVNFPYVYRIVQALAGLNSQNTDFDWPAFGGAGASPATKYNIRQRDSLALQILDIANTSVMVDHVRGFSQPTLSHGIFGNALNPLSRVEPVCGIGRTPKFTEFVFMADTGIADPMGTGHTVPFIQPRITLEFYFPKYYEGVPLENPYAGSDVSQWRMGNKTIKSKLYLDADGNEKSFPSNTLNEEDLGIDPPSLLSDDINAFNPGNPSSINPDSYWQNTLLRINGVDVAGNPAYSDYQKPNPEDPDDPLFKAMRDPSQAAAAAFHAPYAHTSEDGQEFFQGANTTRTSTRQSMLEIYGPAAVTDAWGPGVYHAQDHRGKGRIPYFGMIGPEGFTIEGGVALRTHTASGETWQNFEFTPLDSMRGTTYTGETPETIRNDLVKAVIPVNFTAPDTYTARVADPLVNKFPGDWIVDSAEPTLLLPVTNNNPASIYSKGGLGVNPDFPSSVTRFPSDLDGDNPEYRPEGGGDPLSLWLPRQDVRYPKQSRFPSVGALNYIRTGMIPDDLSVSLELQKGVPFRSLNLSSETSSKGSYPDWAILDLFTVPFVPQLPYFVGSPATPKRRLTYGGATEGKLNINNPLIPYPFSHAVAGVAQVPPERTAPLEALFLNIRTSTRYDNGGEPIYETIDRDKARELREEVQDYLAANGPFRLPGELAEVSAINDYTYKGVAANARSRNDLMREVVGATTTQSNVFSIWIVAQSIRKNPRNTNPAVYEPGDAILGETRRRYIIERHIDYGRDGVPGNSQNPGPDGIVGTEDDPIDAAYHPALSYPLPYHWRIVAIENYSL